MDRTDAAFADDVDHVRALATAPTIVMCGHSYGGSVITAAGKGVNGLAHLVYLAAFALDDRESSSDWYAKRPPAADLTLTAFDNGTDIPDHWGDDDGRYDPEALERIRRFTLRSQVSIPSPVMSEPAWRQVPSAYVVAGRDSVIHPDSQREMAARLNGEVVEIDADHMLILAQPRQVAAVIDRVVAGLQSRGA